MPASGPAHALGRRLLQQAAPLARVRYRKLKDAFGTAASEINFHALDLFEEEPQNA